MLKRVVKTGLVLGISLSGAMAFAVEEQFAEAPSLDAEVTDMVAVDDSYYGEEQENSLLSNTPKNSNAAASAESAGSESVNNASVKEEQVSPETAVNGGPSDKGGEVASSVKAADVKDAAAAEEKTGEDKVSSASAETSAAGTENARTENLNEKSGEAAGASGVPEVKNAAADAKTGASKSAGDGSDTGAASEKTAPAAETGKKAESASKDNKVSAEPETAKKDASGADAGASDGRTIYDILKRRQQADFENPNLYSRDYLSEMYLPYFYNTYELPQELSPYITLRTVRLDKKGSVLVYDIGTADALGPMDFDGTPEDNKTLNLFCRIALNEGVLHRLDKIVLVFYHDDRDYSEVDLDYLKCTGKEPLLVEKSVLSHESVRQDDEFIYAYEAEPEGMLSPDYLKKRFAPFALKRIGEKFDRAEGSPVMTATDDSSLMVLFSVNGRDVARVKQADFVAGRIDRTCAINTYGKWILPRIHELRYVYYDDAADKIVKEVVVTDKTCRAVRSRLKR